MNRIGFDNKKYLSLQSEKIQERIDSFGDKLYLEFGGKLFDDYHASRVLPGFEPDSKIKMLLKLKDVAEILVVISANDIIKNKYRNDLGITYDADVLRLIDIFQNKGLFVGSVVMTMYSPQPAVDGFIKRLSALGVKVYKHYAIEGYPSDVQKIVSENGYGKNEYVPTSRRLVIVTAPGPEAGKWRPAYHNYTTKIYAASKRAMRNLKRSPSGICPFLTPSTRRMKRQLPILTT